MYGASLAFRASHGKLLANGYPFVVKGMTWWGAEEPSTGVFAGLHRVSVDDMVSFAARNGFNAIRVPFMHQRVLFNSPIATGAFDATLNPYLLAADGSPVSYIEMLHVRRPICPT